MHIAWTHRVFVTVATLLLIGCASPFVLLVNPKNGTTVECSGMGRGATSAIMVSNHVDSCVRQYEALGFIRAEQLTDEQRKTIDVKAPEKQHRAISEPPVVVAPAIAPRPSLNCTSNQIGSSTYANCQ